MPIYCFIIGNSNKNIQNMTTQKISSRYNGGMAFIQSINHHQFITDTTADDGGTDSGPGPKRLMLSSLAGCTGIDVVSILNKMKVAFSDFSIDVEARLTDEHPKIYDEVTVVYRIKIAENEQIKMEKAVSLSEEKYCGVMAMFKKFAEVETKIEFLS